MGGAPNTVAQYGALAAFEQPEFLQDYTARYEQRTRRTWEMIHAVPTVKCQMPDAGYNLWIDVSQLDPAPKVCRYLIERARVGVTEGRGFGLGGDGYLRIITASLPDDAAYYAAVERMCDALANYPKDGYNEG